MGRGDAKKRERKGKIEREREEGGWRMTRQRSRRGKGEMINDG